MIAKEDRSYEYQKKKRVHAKNRHSIHLFEIICSRRFFISELISFNPVVFVFFFFFLNKRKANEKQNEERKKKKRERERERKREREQQT